MTGTSFVTGANTASYTTSNTPARYIRSIILPNAATSVPNYAFYNCNMLNDINLPSVTSIGSWAFNYCQALKSVSAPALSSTGGGVFRGCGALKSVSAPAITSIGEQIFWDCASLESVTLGTIPEANYDTNQTTSPGDSLRTAYFAAGGGAGTYTWNGTAWTKQ